MTAFVRSKARRPAVLGAALLMMVALLGVIAPQADAAKPNQIMSAQVRSVTPGGCTVTVDIRINSKGPMKNDVELSVTGPGGFSQTVSKPARGSTLRLTGQVTPGDYTGRVVSRNTRTGAANQTLSLTSFTCA